jgi:hypothetical protein
MKNRFKDMVASVVMFALVFAGITLLGSGYWSTGPNRQITLGVTGWLQIDEKPAFATVRRLSIQRLGVEFRIAAAVTWCLAVALKKARSKMALPH